MLNFYFNAGCNLCADEETVVRILLEDGCYNSAEEALDALYSCREVFGWFDCEVSDNIFRAVFDYRKEK